MCLPCASALRRDDDDPVSCTRAIESSRTGVLDDGDVFDIVGVDRRERTHTPSCIVEDRGAIVIDWYPVDDVERIASCINRAQATDAYSGYTTRLTRIGAYSHPCDSSCELVFEGDGGDVLHILGRDRRGRPGEGGLTCVTIARDDDILDDLFFGLEDDLHFP